MLIRRLAVTLQNKSYFHGFLEIYLCVSRSVFSGLGVLDISDFPCQCYSMLVYVSLLLVEFINYCGWASEILFKRMVETPTK